MTTQATEITWLGGPDIGRLDAAIAWAEAHPGQHDQQAWARRTPCGTTLCLAGIILTQAGYKPVFGRRHETTNQFLTPDGAAKVFPMTEAQRLLRIDTDSALMLFLGAGDLEDIKRYRGQLAAFGSVRE